jgi:hypothetical protein
MTHYDTPLIKLNLIIKISKYLFEIVYVLNTLFFLIFFSCNFILNTNIKMF